VGIATGYGLDGPGIESRWGRDFPHLSQTGPGAHPASCTMGTGSFPGVKSWTGWTVRGSNPGGGGRFSALVSDQPWGPPSLLYIGYQVFPGGKELDGLDGPGIESRWGRDFPHLSQTSHGAHPASCTMATRSFPGLKSWTGWTVR